jgi:hypothetical protein
MGHISVMTLYSHHINDVNSMAYRFAADVAVRAPKNTLVFALISQISEKFTRLRRSYAH